MLSINAVHGFEYGSGFAGSEMRGSEHNDIFVKNHPKGEYQNTLTNFSGGIQGGISNGMPIEFRVAFKPVATIMQSQPTIDSEGNAAEISGKGRHDPCVVPRAVPIVEAMAALVIGRSLVEEQELDFESSKAKAESIDLLTHSIVNLHIRTFEICTSAQHLIYLCNALLHYPIIQKSLQWSFAK